MALMISMSAPGFGTQLNEMIVAVRAGVLRKLLQTCLPFQPKPWNTCELGNLTEVKAGHCSKWMG